MTNSGRPCKNQSKCQKFMSSKRDAKTYYSYIMEGTANTLVHIHTHVYVYYVCVFVEVTCT